MFTRAAKDKFTDATPLLSPPIGLIKNIRDQRYAIACPWESPARWRLAVAAQASPEATFWRTMLSAEPPTNHSTCSGLKVCLASKSTVRPSALTI
jgi:hypothetical protein